MPRSTALAQAAGPQPSAKPTVRMQAPDPADTPAAPARPAPLVLPSPEDVGLGRSTPAKDVDWGDVRRRLDRLGASGFSLQKTAAGYFVAFEVSTSAGPRRAETAAADEADAVHRALAQAEGWAGR
ncbi:MAG: hypothetical protein ACJ8F7_09155 [Gemmataceae bacterium]